MTSSALVDLTVRNKSVPLNKNLPKKKGLLIAPKFPEHTFWGYDYIMPWLGRKTIFSPFGLLTFAAYMPSNWDLEMVDLNVQQPSDEELRNKIAKADALFTGGMSIHRPALTAILDGPARETGTPVVFGGPIASTYWRNIVNPTNSANKSLKKGIDVLVWGDSQNCIEAIVDSVETRKVHDDKDPILLVPDRIVAEAPESYKYLLDRNIFKEFENVKSPRWDLINHNDYLNLGIQVTAGCPFRCEFCDIIKFTGGRTRAKSTEDIYMELQAIYDTGFRGRVFAVDDNFIGGGVETTTKIVNALTEFQRKRGYPFTFLTQLSTNLGKPEFSKVIPKLSHAGYDVVFFGIENPDPIAQRAMNKIQNTQVDIPATIGRVQARGVDVMAGFIFGNDTDTPKTAKEIINYVNNVPIFTAMTGALGVLPGTKLYERLQKEGRLDGDSGGEWNNMDDDVPFEPKLMTREQMKEGVHEILRGVFDLNNSYSRAKKALEATPEHIMYGDSDFSMKTFMTAVKSIWYQGIKPLDMGYFSVVGKGFALDWRRAREAKVNLRRLETFGNTLSNANGKVELDESSRGLLTQMVDHAYDGMVYYKTDRTLGEIDNFIYSIKNQLNEGASNLLSEDALEIYNSARMALKKRVMAHSKGFVSTTSAFAYAIWAHHYGRVKDYVVGKNNIPEAIGI